MSDPEEHIIMKFHLGSEVFIEDNAFENSLENFKYGMSIMTTWVKISCVLTGLDWISFPKAQNLLKCARYDEF